MAPRRVTLEVLAERIDAHIGQNETQYAELKSVVSGWDGRLSDGLRNAHQRIDKIWITAFIFSVGIIGSLVGAVMFLLYEGPPWA